MRSNADATELGTPLARRSHAGMRGAAMIAALLLAGCSAQPTAEPQPDARAAGPANLVTPPAQPPAAAPSGPAADVAAAAPVRATIPAALVGRWDGSVAACAGPRGEMRLDVEPDRLLFYESEARVLSVQPTMDEGVTVEAIATGEGMTEARSYRLIESEDGATLRVTIGDTAAIRVRCGAPSGG